MTINLRRIEMVSTRELCRGRNDLSDPLSFVRSFKDCTPQQSHLDTQVKIFKKKENQEYESN